MSATGTRTARITLDWPATPGFHAVGRLVLGGVAARIDLPVDRVDELGLALDTITRAPVAADRLELEIDVSADSLAVSAGVFAEDPLADRAVHRVVAALADRVETVAAPDGFRVVLTAGVDATG